MISLFDLTDARLPIVCNGLTLNQTPSDPNDVLLVTGWAIKQIVDFVQDANQNTDGLEAYDPRKQGTVLILTGKASAPDQARLFDKMKLLAATFDPVMAARNNPTVNGFLPLDFTTLTNDTVNFASGQVPARYYVRARAPISFSNPISNVVLWKLELLLRDSRRYLQALSSVTLNAPGAANTPIPNSKVDYFSWPTLTVTVSGSATDFQIAPVPWPSNPLDIATFGLVNGDVLVIDMEKHTITKNGVSAMGLYLGGDWWSIPPGSSQIHWGSTYVNISSAVVSWRPAFAL